MPGGGLPCGLLREQGGSGSQNGNDRETLVHEGMIATATLDSQMGAQRPGAEPAYCFVGPVGAQSAEGWAGSAAVVLSLAACIRR